MLVLKTSSRTSCGCYSPDSPTQLSFSSKNFLMIVGRRLPVKEHPSLRRNFFGRRSVKSHGRAAGPSTTSHHTCNVPCRRSCEPQVTVLGLSRVSVSRIVSCSTLLAPILDFQSFRVPYHSFHFSTTLRSPYQRQSS
jgi:hypothetical protein